MAGDLNVSDRWRRWRQRVDLEEYDSRWDRLAAGGASVHDEAELVCQLGGHRILDAGCGTGRVAVELARRGRSVVGVDNDADMLARARARTEDVNWVLADVATMELPAAFDLIVMAGDVLHYVRPGDESLVVSNLARHLKPGGHLVSGASLSEPVQLTHYDNWCRAAGLDLSARYSSWNRAPYDRPGHYAVSVHQRPAAAARGRRRR
ncbi:MAG: class I SAM-dependent methyltransferase [Acidimicrobiales bacterium]